MQKNVIASRDLKLLMITPFIVFDRLVKKTGERSIPSQQVHSISNIPQFFPQIFRAVNLNRRAYELSHILTDINRLEWYYPDQQHIIGSYLPPQIVIEFLCSQNLHPRASISIINDLQTIPLELQDYGHGTVVENPGMLYIGIMSIPFENNSIWMISRRKRP